MSERSGREGYNLSHLNPSSFSSDGFNPVGSVSAVSAVNDAGASVGTDPAPAVAFLSDFDLASSIVSAVSSSASMSNSTPSSSVSATPAMFAAFSSPPSGAVGVIGSSAGVGVAPASVAGMGSPSYSVMPILLDLEMRRCEEEFRRHEEETKRRVEGYRRLEEEFRRREEQYRRLEEQHMRLVEHCRCLMEAYERREDEFKRREDEFKRREDEFKRDEETFARLKRQRDEDLKHYTEMLEGQQAKINSLWESVERARAASASGGDLNAVVPSVGSGTVVPTSTVSLGGPASLSSGSVSDPRVGSASLMPTGPTTTPASVVSGRRPPVPPIPLVTTPRTYVSAVDNGQSSQSNKQSGSGRNGNNSGSEGRKSGGGGGNQKAPPPLNSMFATYRMKFEDLRRMYACPSHDGNHPVFDCQGNEKRKYFTFLSEPERVHIRKAFVGRSKVLPVAKSPPVVPPLAGNVIEKRKDKNKNVRSSAGGDDVSSGKRLMIREDTNGPIEGVRASIDADAQAILTGDGDPTSSGFASGVVGSAPDASEVSSAVEVKDVGREEDPCSDPDASSSAELAPEYEDQEHQAEDQWNLDDQRHESKTISHTTKDDDLTDNTIDQDCQRTSSSNESLPSGSNEVLPSGPCLSPLQTTLTTTTTEGAAISSTQTDQADSQKVKLPQPQGHPPLFRTMYDKWLEHKKDLEEEIRNGEMRKAQFLSRWSNPKGDRPTTAEIMKYELDNAITDKKRRELKAGASKVKHSLGFTSVPKTVNEAMAVLTRIAPCHAIFIKPNERPGTIPLAAPGGVVDEAEVNKDVEMVKERMLKAKKKGLEEMKKQKAIEEEGQGMRKGGTKKKKGGKRQDNGNKHDGGNEEVKVEQSLGDILWYSTLVLPELAQELVDVAKVLEESLGTAGALSALNTSLLEEALAVDKLCDMINFNLKSIKTPYVLSSLAIAHDLGDANAVLHLVRHYLDQPDTREMAKQVMVSAIERGFADARIYKALGDFYVGTTTRGKGGVEAEECYRIASEFEPTQAGEADAVLDAQLGRIRLYARGCPPIQADPVYAAYLLSKIHSTRDPLEPLTQARMYRFGFWKQLNWDRAAMYYNQALADGMLPGEPWMEASHYLAKVSSLKKRDPVLMEAEEKMSLNLLMTSVRLHPDIPDTYAFIAYHHLQRAGPFDRNAVIEKVKPVLVKGFKYTLSKERSSDVRLYCMLAQYYHHIGDISKAREYLTPLEDSIDSMPIELRIVINQTALIVDKSATHKIYDRQIKDGGFEVLVSKAPPVNPFLGLNDPDLSPISRKEASASFSYLIEADKYLSKDPNADRNILMYLYWYLGLYYCPNPYSFSEPDDNKDNGYLPPEDRGKAQYYFQKSLALGSDYCWVYLAKTYYSVLEPWKTGKDEEEKAAKCYAKGIELEPGKCGRAYFELAYLFLHGRGVKQDIKRAREYYTKAVETADDKLKASMSQYDSEFQEMFKRIP